MIGWATHPRRDSTGEAECLEIKLINEGVNDPNRIVRTNIVVEDRRKLDDRMAISTLNVWHAPTF